MTGTAVTEANEFMDIYGLDVMEIPTNVPVARRDLDDEVYRTAEGEVGSHHPRHRKRPEAAAASARRHGLDREERAPVGAA